VAKAYEQDAQLKNVSSVYVAQKDDTIVLFGTVSDAALLKRMENIAMAVEGVKEVDSNQIAIQPDLRGNLLGSGR
jgi:osmotically-inducible protein OsmY